MGGKEEEELTAPWGRATRGCGKGPPLQNQWGFGNGLLLHPPSRFQMVIPASSNKNATLGAHPCHLGTALCCPALSPTLLLQLLVQVSTPLPSGLVVWMSWGCHPNTQPPNSQGIHPTPTIWKANRTALGRVNRQCLAAVITALLFL